MLPVCPTNAASHSMSFPERANPAASRAPPSTQTTAWMTAKRVRKLLFSVFTGLFLGFGYEGRARWRGARCLPLISCLLPDLKALAQGP